MWLGRRGRELGALALAIGVTLLATPIVQLHYFAFLIVPLALARPRLGLAWAPPLAMWVCVAVVPPAWQIATALLIGAAMVAIAVRRDSAGPIVERVGVRRGGPLLHSPTLPRSDDGVYA